MLEFETIFLVRHGNYKSHPAEQLTEMGVKEAERAGQKLKEAGVGDQTVLLSSDAPRARQSSEIIAPILGTTLVLSKRINIIGNYAEGVESLDNMLVLALAEAQAPTSGNSLVVVAHEPLLRIATMGGHIATGQVVQYAPGAWDNSKMTEFDKMYLRNFFDQAGLE